MFLSSIVRPGLAARVLAALSLSAIFLLTGCHNFFVCEGKASCPSSGGTTTTDFVYVSNSASGSGYISGYDLTNGTLTALSGSPVNIGFAPVALNISPSNTFLYAATLPGATNPGIYVFSIASDGALTAANSGNVDITAAVSSMAISPDGNYLFVLNSTGTSMTEYQINSSTGLLSLALTIPVPISTCALAGSPVSQTCSVAVAPSGQFVVVALGTAGDAIFPYTSTSGITSASYTLIPSGSTQAAPTGDYSIALDSNNYAYIARTAALAVYSINSSGTATLVSSATYASTAVPRSVVLNSTKNYVYTANEGASTISAYGIGTTGTLTAVSGSPFTGPSNVSALGADNSGKYMIAAGYGSAGLQLFTIGTTGALTSVTTAANGTATAYPVVLAMSQ